MGEASRKSLSYGAGTGWQSLPSLEFWKSGSSSPSPGKCAQVTEPPSRARQHVPERCSCDRDRQGPSAAGLGGWGGGVIKYLLDQVWGCRRRPERGEEGAGLSQLVVSAGAGEASRKGCWRGRPKGRGGIHQAQGEEEEGSREGGASAQALRPGGAWGVGRTKGRGAGVQAGARGGLRPRGQRQGTRPGGRTSLTGAQMVSLSAARRHLK